MQIFSIGARVVLLQFYWLISVKVRALSLSKNNSESLENNLGRSKMIDKIYLKIVQNSSKNGSDSSEHELVDQKMIDRKNTKFTFAAHVVLLQLHWLNSVEVRA